MQKSSFFKIYFWAILLSATPAYYWLGIERMWEGIDLGVFAMTMIYFFAFVYQKDWFHIWLRRLVFLIGLGWNIYYFYFLPLPANIGQLVTGSALWKGTLDMLLFLPYFLGLYLFAFRPDWKRRMQKKRGSRGSSFYTILSILIVLFSLFIGLGLSLQFLDLSILGI